MHFLIVKRRNLRHDLGMQNPALASLSVLIVAYLERLGADVTSTDLLQRARKLSED